MLPDRMLKPRRILASVAMASVAVASMAPAQEQEPAAMQAPAPGAQQVAVDRSLSAPERTLLRAYHAALEDPLVRQTSLEGLRGQLWRNPPVAFVAGYWATPIDLSALFAATAIRRAVTAMLPQGQPRVEATDLLDDPTRLKQLTAVAFSARPLRGELMIADVGERERVTASEPARIAVLIVPVKDVEWALVEYIPPPTVSEQEPECYFYCGDPENWDFDGDGTPDIQDADDDDDGVPDREDDYPYWPNGSDCGCDADPFIVLGTKFPAQIARAALAVWAALGEEGVLATEGAAGRSVTLGSVTAVAPVELVFPAALFAPAAGPGEPDEDAAAACPNPNDPGVRYMGRDADACAVIRFYCEKGEVGFSNQCGCGCVKAEPEG